MNAKTFLVLALVTVVAVVAAVDAVRNEPAPSAAQLTGEPGFPDLKANPDAVTKIVVSDRDGSFTLLRQDGIWIAQEKHGYRVAPKVVRDIIVAMADMELIEPKTARSERYARLEVEDVSAEQSNSRAIRLEGADGEVLAEAIIGKRSQQRIGRKESGTYLRRIGEPQAWLASGGLTVQQKIEDWLDKDVLDIAGDRVRSVEVAGLSGPSYEVERDSADAELALREIPEGRKAKPSEINRLGTALAHLTFEDVTPRDQLAWPDETGVTYVTTFDGARIKIETAEIDGARWARFAAESVASDETRAEVEEEVEAINARLGPWAYKLADYLAGRFAPPLEDLLEDPDKTS